MILGLLAFIVLAVMLSNRPAPPGFTAPASAYDTEPPQTRVLVIGDSYTGGSDMDTGEAARWPALLNERVPNTIVTTASAGGAGYVAASPITGQTLPQVEGANPAVNYDVVIVFGSRNDSRAAAERVGVAATDLYQRIGGESPEASLIVVGPPWVDADVPSALERNRDAIRRAAEAAGAVWVDPLADGWFFDRPELIGSDGVHPTDAGHAYMADRIAPVVQQVIDSR